MEAWMPPKMWPGAIVYIIGGGPSLKNQDLSFTKNRRTIVTNNAYKLVPWAEVLFFMDYKWYKQHEGWLGSYDGLIVTIAEQTRENRRIKFVERGSKNMLSPHRNVINHGNNSGYCGVHLAYLFGATTIILVGFDMKIVNSQHNFHNDHERKMRDDIYTDEYIPVFDTIREPLRNKGVILLTTTKDSGLRNIPYIAIEEAIKL